MNRSTELYLKISRLLSVVVLAIPFISVFGQSGRKPPQPQSTPTSQNTAPKQVTAKADFVIDTSANKYKLIFLTVRPIKRTYKYKEREEADVAAQKNRDNFIEELNKAGAQGYKLVSSIGKSLVAIVKLDEVQYEYAWFETDTNLFFAKVGFEQKYERMAKQGFRLVDHTLISHICETDYSPDAIVNLETCEINDLFLLERQKGIENPMPYTLVSAAPKWRGDLSLEMRNAISEKVAEGFYPIKAFSEFEIFLEKTEITDERLNDKPDLQVVRGANSLGRDKLEKKVNELARQGYRLSLSYRKIALMYRHADNKTPVTYIWLDTKKKSFEKDLAKLQESGAVYVSTYPNDQGVENKLIFEQSSANGTRREYKVLKFEFQNTENIAEKKVYVDLTPSSKETMKTFNKLVEEGFVVRDLFVSDKVSVLLERTVSK